MTFSVGSGGKGMGRDEQLDEGQNPHCHKQKGRTKENPSEYCCLRLLVGDDTVGYQGHTAQKDRLHNFHCCGTIHF